MINKLFSETNLLKQDFIFHPGLNIILGKYSGEKKALGINGIGKSTLIRLINYLLLSDSDEKIFIQEKYNFLREEKHNVCLEIEINSNSYFIKRDFVNNDKVLFGNKLTNLQEFTKSELRTILVDKFFPFLNDKVYFEGNKYGTLMNFFIKDDLDNQKRSEPLNFLMYQANSRDIAIYNFFLMNLPTKKIIEYDTVMQDYDKFNKTSKGLTDKIQEETKKSIEEFKSERIQIQEKINSLEKNVESFKFIEKYKDAESELASLTSEINEQLKQYHSLSRKLKRVKDSFQLTEHVDLIEIQALYNDAQAMLGDLVKKSLEDVIEFKKDIISNRNKFLIRKEAELKSSIDSILSAISNLETRRSYLYKILDEKGALESIKNSYEEIISQKIHLERNVQVVSQVEDIQSKLSNLDVIISEIKRDILGDLKESESQLNALRALFKEILDNAIFLNQDYSKAYFDVSVKTKSKRTELPFSILVEIPKEDALGQSRLKIVAYDLMTFLINIKQKRVFPDFLIHDGVFHGIAPNTMVNVLNYVFQQSLKYTKFQYFLTFSENEVDIPTEKQDFYGSFKFDWKEYVVAEFSDTEKQMIFKRPFG